MKAKSISLHSVIIPVILMFLSLALLFSVLSAKKRGEEPRLFGYSFHVVMSDSMTGKIEIDDFVVARLLSFEDIKVGDIIIYYSPVENNKKIIHMVTGKDSESGELTTRGVKPGITEDDPYIVTKNLYIGSYVWHSGFIGGIIKFLSDFKNLLFLVVITFCIVLIIRQLKIIFGKKEND